MSKPAEDGKRPGISVVVTTFNEETNIGACLESLLWCDEILVVDSYSTDRTPEIVQRYEEVTFHQRTYYGSAAQKNWAMDNTEYDWILIFDADERCTPKLRQEIESLLAKGPGVRGLHHPPAGVLPRPDHPFLGLAARPGHPAAQEGRAGRYPNKRVHADMKTRGPAPLMRNRMEHYMVEDFHTYVLRIVKYSHWGASQGWKDGRRPGCGGGAGPLGVAFSSASTSCSSASSTACTAWSSACSRPTAPTSSGRSCGAGG